MVDHLFARPTCLVIITFKYRLQNCFLGPDIWQFQHGAVPPNKVKSVFFCNFETSHYFKLWMYWYRYLVSDICTDTGNEYSTQAWLMHLGSSTLVVFVCTLTVNNLDRPYNNIFFYHWIFVHGSYTEILNWYWRHQIYDAKYVTMQPNKAC